MHVALDCSSFGKMRMWRPDFIVDDGTVALMHTPAPACVGAFSHDVHGCRQAVLASTKTAMSSTCQ